MSTPTFQTQPDGSVSVVGAMPDVLMISFDLLEGSAPLGCMRTEGPYVEITTDGARYLFEITERDPVARVVRAELRRVDKP